MVAAGSDGEGSEQSDEGASKSDDNNHRTAHWTSGAIDSKTSQEGIEAPQSHQRSTDTSTIAVADQQGAVVSVPDDPESEVESEAESDDVGYGSYLTFLNGVPRPFMQRVKIECCKTARIAFPAAVATASRLILYATEAAFVGRLGTKELVAASLADAFLIIVIMFMYGCASAVNAFAAQAYGAKNFPLVGIWLQISLVYMTVCSGVVMLVLYFGGELVALVNSDRDVIYFATIYSRWNAAYILPISWQMAFDSYLQAQEIVMPNLIACIYGVTVNFGFMQFFIYGVGSWKGFGLIGSPIALAVTITTQLALYLIIAVWYKGYHKKTWVPWSFAHFTWDRITSFSAMAFSSGLASMADEGVLQVLLLMGGHMAGAKVAALGITFQWFNIVWSIWWGIALATSVRVANHLGAGRPTQAKISFFIGYTATVAMMALFAVFFLLSSELIGRPFSKDPVVIAQSGTLALALVNSISSYCLLSIIVVTLEAMGKYVIVLLLQVFLAVGVTGPLGYYMGTVLRFDDEGIITASALGPFLGFVMALVFMLGLVSWKKAAAKALKRSEMDSSDDDDEDDDEVESDVDSDSRASTGDDDAIDAGLGLLDVGSSAIRYRTEQSRYGRPAKLLSVVREPIARKGKRAVPLVGVVQFDSGARISTERSPLIVTM